MADHRQARAAFADLHQDGCFVIPNPWDVGSARMLQHLGFAALVSGGGRRDPARALPWIAMARAVCRDPDPGEAGEALARIDTTLDAAERLVLAGGRQAAIAIGLVHSTMVFAATEPVGVEMRA